MNGISYSELRKMDLYEFAEAVEARRLWQNEWSRPDEDEKDVTTHGR